MSVEEIAAALDLHVERRLGGMWGAYLVTTERGARVVLKPLPRHEIFAMPRLAISVQLATELRNAGYPVPEYLDFGIIEGQTYTLQEFIDGETPTELSVSHVEQLIELWRLHRDVAAHTGNADPQWPAQLLAGIHAESPALRDSDDPRVQRILDRALAAIDNADLGILRTADAVHGDFHQENLLVRGDTVVAYVDWEGCRGGDSRGDLLMLAFSSVDMRSIAPPARAGLLAEIDRSVPADVRALLASSYAVGKVAFGLRTGADRLQ
ncbi:MAG: phosphotransferase enzyme family protein, partial [bacterium]